MKPIELHCFRAERFPHHPRRKVCRGEGIERFVK